MAVVVLGGVVGLVMRAMGMGAPKAEPLAMVKAPAAKAPVATREPVPAEG
jgi:hypothetical protein